MTEQLNTYHGWQDLGRQCFAPARPSKYAIISTDRYAPLYTIDQTYAIHQDWDQYEIITASEKHALDKGEVLDEDTPTGDEPDI